MGLLWSSYHHRHENDDDDEGPSLLALLATPPAVDGDRLHIDYAAMQHRLERNPEQAAAYGHFLEASPLLRVLLLSTRSSSSSLRRRSLPVPPPPVTLIRTFLDAYEEAAFHTNEQGMTPLWAAAYAMHLSTALQGWNADTAPEAEVQQDDDDDHGEDAERWCAIVKMLLQANAQALQQSATQHEVLPVHFCKWHLPTAELLVKAYGLGVSRCDAQGRIVLHYACDDSILLLQDHEELELRRRPQGPWQRRVDADPPNDTSTQPPFAPPPNIKFIRLLLEYSTLDHGGVLFKDSRDGVTPLDLIFRSWQNLVSAIAPEETLPSGWQARKEQLWNVLDLLVRKAFDADCEVTADDSCEADPFLLVHALVKIRCPVDVLEEALRRWPRQAVQRDGEGRTPLLLAVTDTTSSGIAIDPGVICSLLRHSPQAARMMDREERLPIDHLAEHPNLLDATVLEAMVRAEPRAVDTRDLKYHRHPFLTAALAGAHQGSIFHLLRAQPQVIQHFLQEADHVGGGQ